MGRLDDFVTNIGAGLQQGGADVTRGLISDVGNAYQQILMQGASVGPPDGMTGVMEESTYEMERVQNTPALDADPSPSAVPTPGLDMDR